MKRTIITRTIMLFLVSTLIMGCAGPATASSGTSDTPMDIAQTEGHDEAQDSDATLVGSGNSESNTGVTKEENDIDSSAQSSSLSEDGVTEDVDDTQEQSKEERIKKEQQNSFSMMYYLAIIAEEIRTSRNNRLVLEDIYTSLLNDINPETIDETTQTHLRNLRDIIKRYIIISKKRERLQYVYNRSKAAAIRSAFPNPIGVLSVVHSGDWKALAISVTYSVADSYNQYRKALDKAENDFLINGWELDDEEVAAIQTNRDRAFDYMVDMVQKYNLNGKMTLSEEAVNRFSEICAIESIPEKTRRLIGEEETYRLLGNYWLELAECYFETDKYKECLECVEKYNALTIGIYRKDFNYAKILPKAIVAAQKEYSGDRYVSVIDQFAKDLYKNTSTEDWSSRYFVAQTYIDL